MEAERGSKSYYRPFESRVPVPRWGALLCLAIGLAGCDRTASRGRLDLDSIGIRVGTAGLVAPGRWNFVYVTARASSGVFQGRVRIRGLDRRTNRPLPETFSGKLEVGTERQTVAFPVLLREAGGLVVDIMGPGVPPGTRREPDFVLEDEPRYRILEFSGGGGPSTNQLGGSIHAWLGFPKAELSIDRDSRVRVGTAKPKDLPPNPMGFDVADLVVLSDLSVFESYPEVLGALVDWVRRGGCIAGIPGPSWTVGPNLSPELLEMFGLATPPRVETDASRWPTRDPVGAIYSFDPRPTASFKTSRLLLEHGYGSGRASLMRYAPAKDLLASTSTDAEFRTEVQHVWQRVTVDSWTRFRAQSRILAAAVEPHAMRALYNYSGFTFPSRLSVVVFVLVYLGVGFYFSACIFAYFKRLEWTYIFMLVVAGGASVGIYYFGLISAIQTQTVDSVTVAKVRSGASGTADGAIFFGISSPSRRTVSLEDVIRGGIPSQPRLVESESALDDPFRVLPLDYETSASRIRIDRLELHPNATTYLRVDREFDLGGGLSATTTPDGVLVDNRTPYPLECHVVDRDGIFWLGEVVSKSAPVLPKQGYSVKVTTRTWSASTLSDSLLRELKELAPSDASGASGASYVLARVLAEYAPPASELGENRYSECLLIVDVEEGR